MAFNMNVTPGTRGGHAIGVQARGPQGSYYGGAVVGTRGNAAGSAVRADREAGSVTVHQGIRYNGDTYTRSQTWSR